MAESGPKLGQAMVYRAHAEHRHKVTEKDVDGAETTKLTGGSIHHDAMDEFAGIVGRVHADGSADLLIFPPNRAPVWVDGVKPGDGDHEFTAA